MGIHEAGPPNDTLSSPISVAVKENEALNVSRIDFLNADGLQAEAVEPGLESLWVILPDAQHLISSDKGKLASLSFSQEASQFAAVSGNFLGKQFAGAHRVSGSGWGCLRLLVR